MGGCVQRRLKRWAVAVLGLLCTACVVNESYGLASGVTGTVEVAPSSLVADGVATAKVVVRLRPPLANVPIALGVDDVIIEPAQVMTDSAGVASFKARSTRLGTYQLLPQVIVMGHALPLSSHALMAFTQAPGAAAVLVLDAVPSVASAGQRFNPRLRALDGNGLPDPRYVGSVHFTASDAAATLPADYTFSAGSAGDAGQHVFDAASWATAGPQVLSVSDGVLGSPAVAVQVSAGPALALAVSGLPNPSLAGQVNTTLRVVAVDAFGNVAPSYAGTVRLSSSDAQAVLPADVTLTADSVGISEPQAITLKTSGTTQIVATDLARPALQGQAQITVAPNPASLAPPQLTCSASSTAADGYSAARVVVSMSDTFGNPLPGMAVALGVDGYGNRLVPATGSTDGTGMFSASLASTVAQSKQLYARAGGQKLSCSLAFAPVACPSLAPLAAIPVGQAPLASAVGDLDRDGAPDLVVANAGGSFSVLLGSAGVGGSPASTTALAGEPRAVVLGDINRDGKLDAVFTLRTSNMAAVFLGQGDGTLAGPQLFAAGAAPEGLALADIDRDGLLDVVVAASGDGNVMLLRGHSDGTLQAAVSYPAGPHLGGLVAADLNHDGKPDIAVAGDANVYVLSNQGGTLGAATAYTVPSGAHGIVAADLDRNGGLDLAVATGQGVVLLMSQSGTFATAASASTGAVWGLATGDLDGDSKPDLVASAQGQSLLLRNLGAGSFDANVRVNTSGAPGMPTVADVDRDGRADMVLPMPDANAVGFALNACTTAKTCGAAAFAQGVSYDYQGLSATNVATADFDGDGRIDVAGLVGNNVVILRNQVNGTLAAGVGKSMSTSPRGIAVADYNRDGWPDVAAVSQDSGLCVLLNQGNGTLAAQVLYGTNQQPWVLASGDLDGDGAPDLIDGRRFGADVGLYFNHGNGSFAARVPFFFHASISGVATGDINGDGALDLVLTTNQLAVALNLGGGTFATPTNYPVGTYPLQVGVGDLDGDGSLDVVDADNADNTVTLGFSSANPNGALRSTQAWPTGSGPVGVALGDLNGDGWIDVVTASQTAGAATVLLNQGKGVMGAPQSLPTGPAFDVALADLDGDGRLDIVTTNAAAPAFTVLLNRCQ